MISGLVFFILPFLGISFGLGNHWEALEQEAREREFHRLDNTLLTLLPGEETDAYFFHVVQDAFRRCIQSRDWEPVVAAEFGGLRARFPGLLELVALGPDGQPIPMVSDRVGHEPVLRNLHEVMRALWQEQISEGEVRKRLASGTLRFLGPCAAPDQFFRKRGSLREGQAAGRRRYYLPAVCSKGLLLAFFHQVPEWQVIPVWDRLNNRRQALAAEGLEAGVFDLGGDRFDLPFPAWLAGPVDEVGWSHFTHGGRLFTVFGLTPTGRVWVAGDGRALPDLGGVRRIFGILGNLIVGGLLIWTWWAGVAGWVLPLRLRLLLLFGYSCGLPLLLVHLVGWDYLRDLNHRRVTEFHDQAERLLRGFDTQFQKLRAMLETTLASQFRDLRFGTDVEREETARVVARVLRPFNAFATGVIDEKGSLAWIGTVSDRLGDQRQQKFLKTMVREVLALHNHQDPEESFGAASLFIDAITGMGDPVERIAEQLGRIFNFFEDRSQSWSFFLPIHRDGDQHRFMLFIHWGRADLEQLLLERIIRHHRAAWPEIGFYARIPGGDEEVRLGPIPFEEQLERLIGSLEVRNTSLSERIEVGTSSLPPPQLKGGREREGVRRFLVSGRKSRGIGGFCLLAFRDEEAIRAELDGGRRRLLGFSLLWAVIGGFLGLSLGRRFLEPIGHLARGVEAIKRRSFEARIPATGQDELGALSRTFNQVMDGLSELQIGRIVQESLFPGKGWDRGGYRIQARTLPAGELTGDYFDLMPLPDRRVLFLVGDVTGHGLPAALVMAMAKAVIVGEVGRAREPHRFLEPLHRILLRTMKRRRMMTCILGLLDPARHLLTCANAGHNFPVLFRPGEPPREIQDSCMPLGSWKSARFTSFTLDLHPGDNLLFYTDGLVEATVGGEPIGVATMMAAAGRCLDPLPRAGAPGGASGGPDPATVCQRLLDWHQHLVQGGPQADDITVLVLNRQVAERPQA